MLNLRDKVWKENKSIWNDYVPEKKSIKYFYKHEEFINTCTQYNIKPTNNVQIIKNDTLDSALDLIKIGYNPLVLNMADIYSPGGCIEAGAGMQEESLFRRSNYHRHLIKKDMYPIEPNAAIYSPNVCVFRNNENNSYSNIGFNYLSFVACPALSMPQLDQNNQDKFTEEDEQIFRNKIRLILQIAHENNHDSLILGALGCGAFGCPVKHVAKLFFEEIQNYNKFIYEFKIIIFAIVGKSYEIFKEHFKA